MVMRKSVSGFNKKSNVGSSSQSLRKVKHVIKGICDDEGGESDATSSFSLQECMEEFRARRLRRNYCFTRQDKSNILMQRSADLDLINQNLSNKEQERKFKPCQNGFCYCFTSDSGDGDGNPDCSMKSKNIGLARSAECSQYLTRNKTFPNVFKSKKSYKHSSQINQPISLESRDKTLCVKATTIVEEVKGKVPFIHLIQEFHDGCVISKVKVSKNGMPKLRKLLYPSKKSTTGIRACQIKTHVHNSTNISLKSKNVKHNQSFDLKNDITNAFKPGTFASYSDIQEYGGGKLLQKRLSFTQHNFIPNNMKQPPPKPPRVPNSPADKYYFSYSTSSSVREAESTLDNFIEVGNTKNNEKTPKSDTKIKHKAEMEKDLTTSKVDNNKQFCFTASTNVDTAGDNNRLVPEQIVLTKFPLNNNTLTENVSTVLDSEASINEMRIKNMINFNEAEYGRIHTTSSKYQPQHFSNTDIFKAENSIGWQIPPKLDLDTVDGVEHHNLASNFMDKDTPVKKKLLSPNQNCNGKLSGKAFIWSEKLKYLSPWSKRNSNTNNIKERQFGVKSRDFLTLSKNRFFHLISPRRKRSAEKCIETSRKFFRHFGVQTSSDVAEVETEQKYDHHFTSQSPPGSYHSPMQSSNMRYRSMNSSSKGYKKDALNETEHADFDFSRTVQSPTEKAYRKSQRKLNFYFNSNVPGKKQGFRNTSNFPAGQEKETYLSFNSDLDLDISISKINCVLKNIRLKLEAADQQAMGTFKEKELLVEPLLVSMDCPEKFQNKNTRKSENFFKSSGTFTRSGLRLNEQIYSEIEDESIYLSEGPNFDNHTGIQHYYVDSNPDILYTKVNKCGSNKREPPLLRQLPPKPVKISNSLGSETSVSGFTITEKSPQNFVNAKNICPWLSVVEGESCENCCLTKIKSCSKRQRKRSKSDLSLHRSNVFFEKLCKSELTINGVGRLQILDKRQNHIKTKESCDPKMVGNQLRPNDVLFGTFDCDGFSSNEDSVSYDLPSDGNVGLGNGDFISCRGLDLNAKELPSPQEQKSTPREHSLVAKDESVFPQSSVDTTNKHLYTSNSKVLCSPTRKNICNALSLNESIKNIFRKSFRKSKERGQLLSTTLNFQTSNPNIAVENQLNAKCTSKTKALFTFNESANVCEQIAEAVNICRQLPDIENSMEMVEAERLLLFSALRQENYQRIVETTQTMKQKSRIRFFIDEIYLPILENIENDSFFNFFYIITFGCGGLIKSTQSAESKNGIAVFRNTEMAFDVWSEFDIYTSNKLNENSLKCNIFMLRLRKISDNSVEPSRNVVKGHITSSPSKSFEFTSSTSSSSIGEVVSRFRFQASFTISTNDFKPFIYNEQESLKCGRIFMRASSLINLPLISEAKSTTLSGHVRVKGRADIQVPKLSFDGWLNVQDPYKQYNWNRRYCTLNNFFLYVWQDKNCFNRSPLISIDLRNSGKHKNYPLSCSPRELCGRPRSFYLNLENLPDADAASLLFFSADTQVDLECWLKILNTTIDFIVTWL